MNNFWHDVIIIFAVLQIYIEFVDKSQNLAIK